MIQSDSHTRITLALDIVRRLPDGPLAGYHELAVVKHRIDLHDTLTMAEADTTVLQCDDSRVPVDESNLCLRAAALVCRRLGIDRRVAISLTKRIPIQGGLAGGSANAATTLSMLNELWQLGLDTATLQTLGRELGMDVPFYFSRATTALDHETTEHIEPLPSALAFDLVLVVPSFGVSTPRAYAALDYARVGRRRQSTASMVAAWRRADRQGVLEAVHNDFEQSVFAQFPALIPIRSALLSLGCETAFMSGSGSTMVGIASSRAQAEHIRGEMAGRVEHVNHVLVARSLDGWGE